MKDLLLFSEKLKGFGNYLQFQTMKYWKIFVLLFKWNNNIKIIYNTNTALSNIKALAKNVIKEIKERGFEEMPNTNSTLSHFVLYYLLIKLVQLFFDIQEVNKASLTSPISVEDFYLTELLLPKSKIISLEKTVPDKQIELIVDKTKLKFGFSTNKEALRKVVAGMGEIDASGDQFRSANRESRGTA